MPCYSRYTHSWYLDMMLTLFNQVFIFSSGEIAANIAKKPLLILPSNNFSFFQANDDSLTSLICKGCGLQDQQMIRKPKPVAERIDIHTCETLLSGLREASYWPQKWSQKQSHSL